MNSLRDHLQQAQQSHQAVGHFNVSELVALKAVFAAAQELKVPVIVGLSEGEREFVGTHQIAALVRSLREEFDFPIFLNADHTHSLTKGLEAAKAGFDSIVFDLSALPFEENIRQTKQAVEDLKSVNPSILVEGEIGDIGSGSEIHETAPDLSKGLSTPEQARQFVESTKVDILAPYVGQYARHAQEHGRRPNEEALAYRQNCRHQTRGWCLPRPPVAAPAPMTKIFAKPLPRASTSSTSIRNFASPGVTAW